MRQKTYFPPGKQLELSTAHVLTAPRDLIPTPVLGLDLWLGQIVLHHRLFVPGDMVFIRISNGFGERQPVWGVSSKGYTVSDYYLQYSKFQGSRRFDAGPLRFIGLSARLEGLSPDDPAAQLQMLRLRSRPLRAGIAADG